jgi:hypothetical protein
MQGELESLYKQYKQGIKIPNKNPLKKISPTTKQGVPNPVIDGEMDSDISSIGTCQKCGSMNISIDLSTNKVECRDCKEKSDKSTKVDFQKMMEKVREEEQNKIDESIKRGDVFLK